MTLRCCAFSLLGAALLALGVASPSALARETEASVFAGAHVDDNWPEVFRDPSGLDWRDTALAGVTWGRSWPSADGSVRLGFEVQMAAHAGEQDHLELNLPVTLRWRMPRPLPVRSLAAGAGPSWASEVPRVEVLRKGDSARLMLYWMLEAEFGPREAERSVFLRLHHRSNAYGLFAEAGGSNAVVLGLRRRW